MVSRVLSPRQVLLLQALGVDSPSRCSTGRREEPVGEKRPLLLAWASQVSWICLVLVLALVAVFRYHSAARLPE